MKVDRKGLKVTLARLKGRTGEGKEGEAGGRKGKDDCYSKLFRPCVGLTVRILLCSVRKYTEWTLCCEVACLSVTLMCCARTTKRIKLPFRVRVTPSIVTLLYYTGVLIPLKIAVRGTSPKFTQSALPQSHLAVYISGIV